MVEGEDLPLNYIKQKAQERLCPGSAHGIPEGQEVNCSRDGNCKTESSASKIKHPYKARVWEY